MKRRTFHILYKAEDKMNIVNFFKKNTVLCIAMVAAFITMFIVPPDAQYLGYFDYKTLTCLFCVLAVVCAFKNIDFFYILARKVVESFRTARMCLSPVLWSISSVQVFTAATQ